jgi:hypothetical protein
MQKFVRAVVPNLDGRHSQGKRSRGFGDAQLTQVA